jgi:hypothetical protein
MRHERILQLLVLAELVLFLMGTALELVVEAPLVTYPGGYAPTAPATPPPIPASLLTGLWAVVATGTLLGWIGLLFLVSEARGLYLGSWVAYLLLLVLRGSVVETPVDSVLQVLTAGVGGAILAVVYFSELRNRFRPLVHEPRAPDPKGGRT